MRPIDADELKADLHMVAGNNKSNKIDVREVIERIDLMRTLDVKPVVHAHWNVIDHGEEIVNAYPHYWATLKCSNCGVERDVEDYYSPSFCENCGAAMDEEKNNG